MAVQRVAAGRGGSCYWSFDDRDPLLVGEANLGLSTAYAELEDLVRAREHAERARSAFVDEILARGPRRR